MASETQPAHIHKGSCAKLDPTPAYALADVKDGASTSTVDVKLDDLRHGAFAINVHESAAADPEPTSPAATSARARAEAATTGGSGYGY